MTISHEVINWILTILTPILMGWVYSSLKESRKAAEERFVKMQESIDKQFDTIYKSVEDLAVRVAQVEVKMSVFWKDVTYDAARILHKPHPEARPMDRLLERYMQEEISEEEVIELKEKLRQKIQSEEIDSGERTAASFMLRGIEALHPTKSGGLA